MSRYEERLARKEALRDPLDPSPPVDEDEPSGILRRKLSVSFGNRFKESGAADRSEYMNTPSGGALDVIQDSITEIFADTPVLQNYEDSDEEDANQRNWRDSDVIDLTLDEGKEAAFDYKASTAVIPKLSGGTRPRQRLLSSSVVTMPSVISVDQPEAVSLSPSHPSKRSLLGEENEEDHLFNKEKKQKSKKSAASNETESLSSSSSFSSTFSPVSSSGYISSPTSGISSVSSVGSNTSNISESSNNNAEESVPPEGWIKAFSNKQNKPYWYNVVTKKSVWVFPKDG